MGLGFLLLILSGHWLEDWAFLIFEGPSVLVFNTNNILDLNTIFSNGGLVVQSGGVAGFEKLVEDKSPKKSIGI